MIDPGHGGENLGCQSEDGQLYEKDYTLQIAERMTLALQKAMPHIDVKLTRHSDEESPATWRSLVANEWPADLLLSLHANASLRRDQTGFESFVLDPARRHARRMMLDASTTRANASYEPGLRNELAWRHDIEVARDSRRFADILAEELVEKFPQRPNRGVRMGTFDVLVDCRVPCVLHEIGFLDHAQEGPWMRTPAAQNAIVHTLVRAVARYYRYQVFGGGQIK